MSTITYSIKIKSIHFYLKLLINHNHNHNHYKGKNKLQKMLIRKHRKNNKYILKRLSILNIILLQESLPTFFIANTLHNNTQYYRYKFKSKNILFKILIQLLGEGMR